MVLLLHIAIALLSIIYTAYVYFAPSRAKLRGSYALVALTVASGTWLIIANPTHMVQSCITGLLYLGVIFYGIHLSSNKLALQQQEQESDKR
jgi:hypothetical protein